MSMRKTWGLLGRSLAFMAWASGCASDDAVLITAPRVSSEAFDVEESGTLRLPLVTPDVDKFRLSNAIFDVQGSSSVPVVSLDSEVDPNSAALTAELAQGFYRATLRDGWRLQRLAADGTAAAVRAALVSPNPSTFSIRNDRVTQLVFTFTTDSGTVTFGAGSISIGAAFADPASLASCDLINQAGCDVGQSCLIANESGRTFCATAGKLSVGSPCDSEQCVIGAQCLNLEPAVPQGVCTQLCNPQVPTFGCDCRGLDIDDNVGVCGPAPAGTCDLLTQAGCDAGEACQFPAGSFGVCGVPGTLDTGASCLGEECVAGLDCFGDDPQAGFFGTCLAFCDLQAPSCDFCFDVGTGNAGRCFF